MSDIITIAKICIYAVFAWFGISVDAFIILLTLMSLDSIVGAIRAIRMGEKFSFKIMNWGIGLKLCFLIIPLVVALLGKSLDMDFVAGVNVVISMLSVSEGYSILGNIYMAKNKVKIKNIDIVSLTLIALRKGLMMTAQRIVSKIENLGDCEIKK